MSYYVQKTGVIVRRNLQKKEVGILRDVTKVLLLRNDLSHFLVHLTRDTKHRAKTNLARILSSCTLECGPEPISDARFRYPIGDLDNETKRNYFSAISFTETPIGEIHNLLEIGRRKADLKPYGVVFLKERLRKRGVSPVIYVNNLKGDQDKTVEALCSLIKTPYDKEARRLLPLVAVFGKMLSPREGTARNQSIDFTWEREWRYAGNRSFKFSRKDLFIGLCPDKEISYFEAKFDWLGFIDPRLTMKWYAEKLLDVKKRRHLEFSVV
jgi:hypothetical protein